VPRISPRMHPNFRGRVPNTSREGGHRRVTGHVFRVERKRGPVWYAKYRLPSGRQVQKLIEPA
jgi:hypothetical protein